MNKCNGGPGGPLFRYDGDALREPPVNDTPMIDPRPMDPPSYWVVPPSGMIEWTIIRRKWNRENQKHDIFTEHGSGQPIKVLETIVKEIEVNPEFEIEIDATMADFDREELRDQYRALKSPPDFYFNGLDWCAVGEDTDYEYGWDGDDMIDMVWFEMEQRRTFSVTIGYGDPTP
jgi:hypothetical protein